MRGSGFMDKFSPPPKNIKSFAVPVTTVHVTLPSKKYSTREVWKIYIPFMYFILMNLNLQLITLRHISYRSRDIVSDKTNMPGRIGAWPVNQTFQRFASTVEPHQNFDYSLSLSAPEPATHAFVSSSELVSSLSYGGMTQKQNFINLPGPPPLSGWSTEKYLRF